MILTTSNMSNFWFHATIVVLTQHVQASAFAFLLGFFHVLGAFHGEQKRCLPKERLPCSPYFFSSDLLTNLAVAGFHVFVCFESTLKMVTYMVIFYLVLFLHRNLQINPQHWHERLSCWPKLWPQFVWTARLPASDIQWHVSKCTMKTNLSRNETNLWPNPKSTRSTPPYRWTRTPLITQRSPHVVHKMQQTAVRNGVPKCKLGGHSFPNVFFLFLVDFASSKSRPISTHQKSRELTPHEKLHPNHQRMLGSSALDFVKVNAI